MTSLERRLPPRFSAQTVPRFSFVAWWFGALLLLTALVPGFLNKSAGLTISVQMLLPLAAVVLCPVLLWKRFAILILAGLYIILAELVNGWSPLSATREAYFLLHFGLASAIMMYAVERQPARMRQVVQIFIWANALMIPVVLLFRLFPGIEASYLSSPVVRLFVSPAAMETLKGNLGNNVLDPDKAAGLLYVNGNQAAAYMIAVACLAAVAFRGWLKYALAGLIFLGAVATGSKTPLFAIPLVLGAALFVKYTTRIPLAVRLTLLLLLLVGWACLDVLYGFTEAVGQIDTFAVRTKLWSRALYHLPEYWLFGAFEGYWDQLWYDEGALYWTQLPVHNYALRVLMIGGAGSLLLIIVQFIQTQRQIVLSADWNGDRVYYAFAAFLYVAIYSLVENFTIFGDFRVAIVLAATLAVATAKPVKLERARAGAPAPLRRRRTALPAKVSA